MNRSAPPALSRRPFIRWTLILSPLLLVAGMISGFASGSGEGNPWFAMLAKPDLYPPPITFPIVWTALYLLMGAALAIAVSAPRSHRSTLALLAFAAQFVLNLAWSPTFFAAHQISGALLVIVLLDLALIATNWLFGKVRRRAAWLLAPYLAWTLFATGLNWQILQDNAAFDGAASAEAIRSLAQTPS